MYCYEYPHPAVTTDVVVFAIRNDRLEFLLIKRASEPYQGHWALPGGFVDIDEDLNACALRELEEETGITGVYLEQLCSVGTPRRDPRERVISVVYFAVLAEDKLEARAASDAAAVAWFSVRDYPRLAFDHNMIVQKAHHRLAAKLSYSTIALQFMPRRFTLSQLQRVYELILGEELDKRNFRKRVLSMDCLKEDGGLLNGGKHRPAKLYQAKQPDRVDFVR